MKVSIIFSVPYRTEPYRILPNRTEPYRTVTSKVTLDSNGKYDGHTNCSRYYHYGTIKNNALRAPLQIWSRVTVIVTVFYKRYWHRYK